MELMLLGVFAAGLIVCVMTGASILYALLFGYVLFFAYGIRKGHSQKEMVQFTIDGVAVAKNILLTFLLIGVITAVWRACGAIAFIVYHATELLNPSIMILAVFLLCCLMSVLTGTSMGSAATMGVICMTLVNSMGISPVLAAGAVLSGIFFGDRCSPMSTSALLVSELTKTNIYRNLVNMVKTSIVPFVLACIGFFLLGLNGQGSAGTVDVRSLLGRSYDLTPIVLIPVIAIVVLSLLRMKIRPMIIISSVCGIAIACLVQGMGAAEMVRTCLLGFKPQDAELAALMGGGGMISMLKSSAIVCISSSYAGIFRGTGFLLQIQGWIRKAAEKVTAFGAILLSAIVTSAFSCNQALAIMLTHQLCEGLVEDAEQFAVHLEDTAVVVAPLIPWSIAMTATLGAAGAPTEGAIYAFYLYLLPLYQLLVQLWKKNRRTA